jgi:hypothetical protein
MVYSTTLNPAFVSEREGNTPWQRSRATCHHYPDTFSGSDSIVANRRCVQLRETALDWHLSSSANFITVIFACIRLCTDFCEPAGRKALPWKGLSSA